MFSWVQHRHQRKPKESAAVMAHISFSTSCIPISGGRMKFISNMDVFMCSPTAHFASIKVSSSWHILLHLSHLHQWRQYKVHIKYWQYKVHIKYWYKTSRQFQSTLELAYPSPPQSSPPVAAVQSSYQILMFSCVLLAIVINSHSAIHYLPISWP